MDEVPVNALGMAYGNWRDFAEPTLPPLLQAAATCFVENGYHGTSTRGVAARAGLSVPGYYHHYESKQAVLIAIMRSAMRELYGRSLSADRDAGSRAKERLDNHIECLVLFHAYRADLAFIASSEIRALRADARIEHIAARDQQEALLNDIVAMGIADGDFHAPHPRDVARALITMCTGVSQWYKLGGDMAPEDLASRYVGYASRMLEA